MLKRIACFVCRRPPCDYCGWPAYFVIRRAEFAGPTMYRRARCWAKACVTASEAADRLGVNTPNVVVELDDRLHRLNDLHVAMEILKKTMGWP